jgi:hypothetical protein
MPTAIEQAYLDQGYVLPAPLTWGDVAERRVRWTIAPIHVPLAFAPGCLSWGVPVVNGKPRRHP